MQDDIVRITSDVSAEESDLCIVVMSSDGPPTEIDVRQDEPILASVRRAMSFPPAAFLPCGEAFRVVIGQQDVDDEELMWLDLGIEDGATVSLIYEEALLERARRRAERHVRYKTAADEWLALQGPDYQKARTEGVFTEASERRYDMISKVVLVGNRKSMIADFLVRWWNPYTPLPDTMIHTIGVDYKDTYSTFEGLEIKQQVWVSSWIWVAVSHMCPCMCRTLPPMIASATYPMRITVAPR